MSKQHFECEYIKDEHDNVSGIKFIDVGCKGTLLNHRFVINVGQF